MKISFWVKSVKVSLSFWFFAVLAFFFALDTGVAPYILLLPIAAHELGHIAAIWCCGVKISEIEFTAFGIEIKKAGGQTSYAKEIAVAASGILVNAAFALFLYFAAFKSMRVLFLMASNLAVGAFNILPIGSLDGGIMVKLLSQRFFAPRTAFVISLIFSLLALVPLFALSFLMLLRPEKNFTLLAAAVYLAAEIIRSE